MQYRLARRLVAECLGTGFLVAAVVGSGIMAERLAGGNVALALLANTIATGAALVALILTFVGVSGAHFNPAVSMAQAIARNLSWSDAGGYIAAQFLGGFAGAAIADLMFGLPALSLSQHARYGAAQFLSECVAAFGLVAVIHGCARHRPGAIAYAVGAYITAAYWFTASTSFANPAVTLARAFSDTFAGIRLQDVPAFITAQLVGAISATVLFRWLLIEKNESSLSPEEKSVSMEVLPMKTYIFACVHNAGRSQMAAAFFNLYARSECRAVSAGTAPAEKVHPKVLSVMKEIGIDLSQARPQRLTEALAREADVLVTMGCGETCPYVPGLRVIDWALPDPKGQPVEKVRQIRDQIHEKIKQLLKEECPSCCATETLDTPAL